jgi:hypothetical protein
MSTFDHFSQLVEEVEGGRLPARFSDRASAIKALVGEICGAPWESGEERERAQGLVLRLERMKWADEAPGCSSADPPPGS